MALISTTTMPARIKGSTQRQAAGDLESFVEALTPDTDENNDEEVVVGV
jgi:hypothetical protein